MHPNVDEKRVEGKMGVGAITPTLQSKEAQTPDPTGWKLNPVLHTTPAPAGFSAPPGCSEVVTWRLGGISFQPDEEVAFPARGSPSIRALRQGEPRGGAKGDVDSFPGQRRGQRVGLLARSR